MAYFSGKDGALAYNGQTIAKTSQWSFSGSQTALDVTHLEKNARVFSVGLKSASGNATVWVYLENHKTLAEKVIRTDKPLDANDILGMELRFGNRVVGFNCLITSASLSSTTGEAMAFNINFRVTGNITTATLAAP